MLTKSLITIGMLLVSNVFMTFAWYGLAEYSFQIPANRIGFVDNGGPFTLMQLKVIQEAITLVVFTVFTVVLFKGESLHWNHFVAFLLILCAVYFAFLDTGKA